LHPQYATTQWARKQDKPFIQIQHHYAHVLSAMFEHHLKEKVLGIAWDGTGYGDDGTIWGGEFLLCDTTSYERVAFFEPFYLLGGDASIRDIKRILLSLLFDIEQNGHSLEPFTQQLSLFNKDELKVLHKIHSKHINSPLCSSVGRIFDAVAVMCGLSDQISYDGESGLMIEALYDETITEAYPLKLDGKIIQYKHIFNLMAEDKDPHVIASKFINALACIADTIARDFKLKTIVCGGVFQNRTLLEKLLSISQENILFPHNIPINDSGICMGQLYKMLSK
ncbi:MAG: carbamoyltransferase HypF, partial [Sulfurospirillaceae bacterium]|nr:carbamoyltransferase HypF [Sulfurospirillaceae bacterium]